MGRKPHIIDVGGRIFRVGHGDGVIPEAEVVYSVGTFCYGKKGFTVGSLYTHHEYIFAIPFHRTRIKGCIHPDTFHQVWIGLLVEVVTPENRCMCTRKNRVLIACIYSVASGNRFVLCRNQHFVLVHQSGHFVLKSHHQILFV